MMAAHQDVPHGKGTMKVVCFGHACPRVMDQSLVHTLIDDRISETADFSSNKLPQTYCRRCGVAGFDVPETTLRPLQQTRLCAMPSPSIAAKRLFAVYATDRKV